MPGAPPPIAIIPARLGSTRLPGKVLLARTGKPLIQHVYEAARRVRCLSRVVIATDDRSVREAVLAFGGECIMTSPAHPNGTSRLAEACDALGLASDAEGERIIVNIQGDEPEIEPALVEGAVGALIAAPTGVAASTVAVPFAPSEDPTNPNIVKVVRRRDGTALYFSRSRIPFDRDATGGDDAVALRHVGLYCYHRWFLARYAALEPTPLERAEKLEQLRILEHGHAIALSVAPAGSARGIGIDTPEQYEAFVRRITSG
jgi:3-deoxy-manno-octulosonate cytidylyltransferase (CMP-KDO synthetase)